MRFVHAIEGFVYRSSRTKLIAAVVACAFVKTGIWYMPNFDGWKNMRLDPFHNPFASPEAHYLFWNWLGPFLAWRFRIHNEHSFLYFHLFFSPAFTASYIWLAFRILEEREAHTALILFMALPVSATAYFWIGMDSITLALIDFHDGRASMAIRLFSSRHCTRNAARGARLRCLRCLVVSVSVVQARKVPRVLLRAVGFSIAPGSSCQKNLSDFRFSPLRSCGQLRPSLLYAALR